jgi:hypothetical protein
VVEEGFEKKVVIPYNHKFDKGGEGKIIHGTVTKNDLIVEKTMEG